MARKILAVVIVLAGVAACGRSSPGAAPSPAGITCRIGDTAMIRTEVLVGRSIPGGGEVSDSAWKEFVGSFVTPRFPEGLTIIDSDGQWRNAAGVVERERGKILLLTHGEDATAQRKVDEIAVEYKRRFRQEAVMRVRVPVCVHFDW